MKATLEGGCLCGAVRYAYAGQLGGELGSVTLCHCSQCRRAASYGVAVAPAEAAGLVLVEGRDAVAEYQSSPGKWRAFCPRCGSGLWSRREANPSALRLRIGTMDNPPESLRIEAHIFTADLPPWSAPDGAPRYPGLEPGRPG